MKLQDQEAIIEALTALSREGPEQHLKVESIRIIERALGCSRDRAAIIQEGFEGEKLIELSITRGGELDARRPMPVARWIWVRPSTTT